MPFYGYKCPNQNCAEEFHQLYWDYEQPEAEKVCPKCGTSSPTIGNSHQGVIFKGLPTRRMLTPPNCKPLGGRLPLNTYS